MNALKSFKRSLFCLRIAKAQVFGAEHYIREHVDLEELVLRILKYQSHVSAKLLFVEFLSADILSIIINVP